MTRLRMPKVVMRWKIIEEFFFLPKREPYFMGALYSSFPEYFKQYHHIPHLPLFVWKQVLTATLLGKKLKELCNFVFLLLFHIEPMKFLKAVSSTGNGIRPLWIFDRSCLLNVFQSIYMLISKSRSSKLTSNSSIKFLVVDMKKGFI